jgi:hypothetical protein
LFNCSVGSNAKCIFLKQDLLLDPNEPALTDIGLQNFDVDVRFLEDFVKNLGDPTIVDTFLELRQVSISLCRKMI